MAYFISGERPGDASKTIRSSKASKSASLMSRIQAMQKQINARNFMVLRLNGTGLPSTRRLACVLHNLGADIEAYPANLIAAYGTELEAHLDSSLLPVLWNGSGEHQVAETSDFGRFMHRLKGGILPFSGIAFPIRLGSQGNGYMIFIASYIDVGSEIILDLHGRSCMVMTDMLAASEKRLQPSETLNDREIACLQMAGDGCISDEIAERMGLSVHTVNAYLGAATTKLNSVNRIQAIAKAIRLGYIS